MSRSLLAIAALVLVAVVARYGIMFVLGGLVVATVATVILVGFGLMALCVAIVARPATEPPDDYGDALYTDEDTDDETTPPRSMPRVRARVQLEPHSPDAERGARRHRAVLRRR